MARIRKRYLDIDKLLGIDHNPKKAAKVLPVEEMEERIGQVWREMGFKYFQVTMGLDFAHGEAKSLVSFLPPRMKRQAYPYAFKRALSDATRWLLRVKEELEGAFE